MSKQDKKELRQQIACEWLENNYLNYGSLRHDIVTDRLQIRMPNLESLTAPHNATSVIGDPAEDASLQNAPEGLQFRDKEVWRNLTDKDINTMVCNCVAEAEVNISVTEMWTALKSDMVPAVHPIRAWLEGLKPYTPDQPDWIDWVASQVKVKPSGEEAKGDKARGEELWRKCFKKWFVAMVASWMKDEVVNHTVLVLVGRQGIFKTTWLDNLIPPELRAYSSKLPLSGQISKDDRLRLCENAMLNIDELDAICGREMNIVKSLLTSTDVNERAAYGRLKERRVRLASFCASTNNHEFLTDITGNRRWLPFEVESIQNPFHAIIPYEQLYAQAVYLIEQGWYMYWFDLEEIEELEKHNEEFRAMENEEQLIPILFDIPAKGKGEFMTTAEISDTLVSYGGIKKPMSIRQLGMLLAKRGFQKKQVYLSGSNVRGWIVYKRHTDEIELLKKIDSHSATSQPTNLY
ncbi:MAG: hypothetical protein J6U73_06750 [Alistipes sp.]|nr:hypothetical protein [Alistipes sp.]